MPCYPVAVRFGLSSCPAAVQHANPRPRWLPAFHQAVAVSPFATFVPGAAPPMLQLRILVTVFRKAATRHAPAAWNNAAGSSSGSKAQDPVAANLRTVVNVLNVTGPIFPFDHATHRCGAARQTRRSLRPREWVFGETGDLYAATRRDMFSGAQVCFSAATADRRRAWLATLPMARSRGRHSAISGRPPRLCVPCPTCHSDRQAWSGLPSSGLRRLPLLLGRLDRGLCQLSRQLIDGEMR